jgi:hypothetical protein
MATGVLTLYLLDYVMLHNYMMAVLWVSTWYVRTTDALTATMKYFILCYGGWVTWMYINTLVVEYNSTPHGWTRFIN